MLFRSSIQNLWGYAPTAAGLIHATMALSWSGSALLIAGVDSPRRRLALIRLGPVLVDAKGVNRLYEGRVRRRDLLMVIGAALVAMITVSIVSEPIHVFLRGITLSFRDLWYSVFGAL